MPNKERKTENNKEENECKPVQENSKNSPKSIEEWEELQLRSDFDALDTRRRPEYTVSYKQDVKTEDLFLQVTIT